jgi:hypothetical protein
MPRQQVAYVYRQRFILGFSFVLAVNPDAGHSIEVVSGIFPCPSISKCSFSYFMLGHLYSLCSTSGMAESHRSGTLLLNARSTVPETTITSALAWRLSHDLRAEAGDVIGAGDARRHFDITA